MCHHCSRNCIGCECPNVSPSSWHFLFTVCQHIMAPRYLTAQLHRASNVGLVKYFVWLPVASIGLYARRRRPCSMFLNVYFICSSLRTRDHRWPCVQFNCSSWVEQFTNDSALQSSESLDIFRRRLKTELFARFYNWHRACQPTLLLRDSLSLSLQLFAVAATLKSTDYNVAKTFILNNNNNNNNNR